MPVVIVALVLGAFLLFMKMVLDHRKQIQPGNTISEGSAMSYSELEGRIEETVQLAIEPIVARLDELESHQLLASSERMLLGEKEKQTPEARASESTSANESTIASESTRAT